MNWFLEHSGDFTVSSENGEYTVRITEPSDARDHVTLMVATKFDPSAPRIKERMESVTVRDLQTVSDVIERTETLITRYEAQNGQNMIRYWLDPEKVAAATLLQHIEYTAQYREWPHARTAAWYEVYFANGKYREQVQASMVQGIRCGCSHDWLNDIAKVVNPNEQLTLVLPDRIGLILGWWSSFEAMMYGVNGEFVSAKEWRYGTNELEFGHYSCVEAQDLPLYYLVP